MESERPWWYMPVAPISSTEAAVDNSLSNVESLLVMIGQRQLTMFQQDRLAAILQHAERRLLGRE